MRSEQYINLVNAGNLLYADKKRIAGLELTGEVKSSFESATVGNPLNSVAFPGGGAQAESAGRRDSADVERHSLMFGLPTSGARMRAERGPITTDRMGNLVPRHLLR